MPVYDRSYRRWDGELKRRALRFIPITTMGVRNALGMKGGWFFTLLLRLFMLGSIVPTLVLFFLNYALVFRPTFLPADFLGFLDMLRPYRAIQYPLLTSLNVKFLMVYTVLFGSGLIAKDRASGALPLYLSRPLSLADYVIGKAGIIGWFVAAFTLVPNLVIWTFGVLADDAPHALRDALPQLLPIFVQNLVAIAVYSLTILAASALCRRPMFAGLIWFTMMILMQFTVAIGAKLGWDGLPAASPNDALFAIGYDLFNVADLFETAKQQVTGRDRFAVEGIFALVNPFSRTPPSWCWVSVAAWCSLSLAILLTSLRRQEVVGDSGRR